MSWKTIDYIEHSWCIDNYGLEQTIYLQEENGQRRLKLYRHNDDTMTVLPLLSAKGSFEGFDKLPHGDYTSLMEGNGYGAEADDLIELAETAGMEFNKSDVQKDIDRDD